MNKRSLITLLLGVTMLISYPTHNQGFEINKEKEAINVSGFESTKTFPFSDNYELVNSYGDNINYNEFNVNGDVLAVVDGIISMKDFKDVVLTNNNVKIVYEGINVIKTGAVKSGDVIGKADGDVKVYLYVRNILEDFMSYYYFPDQYKTLLLKQGDKEKQKYLVEQQHLIQQQEQQARLKEKIDNLRKYEEQKIAENYLKLKEEQAKLESLMKNRIGTDRLKSQYDDVFNRISQIIDIDVNLLKSVAYIESGFNNNSVSSAGAIGIMQIMPSTAQRFGATDIHDPVQNIAVGAALLKFLMVKYDNNLDLVLAAYNAGEGAVNKYNGIPPYNETINYVKNVKAIYDSSIARKD